MTPVSVALHLPAESTIHSRSHMVSFFNKFIRCFLTFEFIPTSDHFVGDYVWIIFCLFQTPSATSHLLCFIILCTILFSNHPSSASTLSPIAALFNFKSRPNHSSNKSDDSDRSSRSHCSAPSALGSNTRSNLINAGISKSPHRTTLDCPKDRVCHVIVCVLIYS